MKLELLEFSLDLLNSPPAIRRTSLALLTHVFSHDSDHVSVWSSHVGTDGFAVGSHNNRTIAFCNVQWSGILQFRTGAFAVLMNSSLASRSGTLRDWALSLSRLALMLGGWALWLRLGWPALSLRKLTVNFMTMILDTMYNTMYIFVTLNG